MEKINRLIKASEQGNLETIKSIIEEEKIDINSQDEVNKSFFLSFFLS